MKKILYILIFLSVIIKAQITTTSLNNWKLDGNTLIGKSNTIGFPVLNTQTISSIRIAPTANSILDIGGDGAGSFYLWANRQGSKTYSNYNMFLDQYDILFNDSNSFQVRFNNVSTFALVNNKLSPNTDYFRMTAPSFTRATLGESKRFYLAARTVGFNAGGTLAAFRDTWIEPTTYTAAATSTITDLYALKVDSGLTSTNVKATRNWGIFTNGMSGFGTKVRIGNNTTPTATLDVTGTMSVSSTTSLQNTYITHIIGKTAAPTLTFGTGAGTTPTVAISNATDLSGIITFTAGTTPVASSTVLTVTFNSAYGVAPNIVVQARNSATALLSGTTECYPNSTTSKFDLISGTAALTAGVVYTWYYYVLQ